MKINKVITRIGAAIGSAFTKKKDGSIKPTGQEVKTAQEQAATKEAKKYTPSIFGKKNNAMFVSRSITSATAQKRTKHVNKAKFSKKAKLKRRKAA